MRRMMYQVSVGKPSKLYETCIASVAHYCKKYSIDHIIQTEPILKISPDLSRTGRSKEAVERLGYLPIYEKENAFSYIDQYDQIAIVDSDIYIKDSAPNIFNDLTEQYAFGAVAERELPCTAKYRMKITKYSNGAFIDLKDVDWKWNKSGAEFYNIVEEKESNLEPEDTRLIELAKKFGKETVLIRPYKGVDYELVLDTKGFLHFKGEVFNTPNKAYNNGIVKHVNGKRGGSGTNHLSQFA